jgi:hypothetical protein
MNDNKVVFTVGRMNPPTPGHVLIAQEVLNKAKLENALPRIYLSSTTNNVEDISTQRGLSVSEITPYPKTKFSLRSSPGTAAPAYVKDSKFQNPLTPSEKKMFLIDMLVNRAQDTSQDLDDYRRRLQDIVTTDCNGLFKAFRCAESLQSPDSPMDADLSKITWVLGKELDAAEAVSREKNCASGTTPPGFTDEGRPLFDCHFLVRDPDTTGKGPESYSGSRIRLLAGCKNADFEEFATAYNGYLTRSQAATLFDRLRQGMCILDHDSAGIKRSSPSGSPTGAKRIKPILGGRKSKNKKTAKNNKKKNNKKKNNKKSKKNTAASKNKKKYRNKNTAKRNKKTTKKTRSVRR